jgi:structural maintenance of chromosome 4
VKIEYEQLRSERKQKFELGFRVIAKKLSEIYMDLSQGGNAEIEIIDTLDPFSEGI